MPARSTKPPAAAKPSRSIFDPFNSSATGHQRADNTLSGSTSWRDSRSLKLRAQYTGGTGGGKRVSDTVGAGSLDFGQDGRTENGGWVPGAKGLRGEGQKSLWESTPGLAVEKDVERPSKRVKLDVEEKPTKVVNPFTPFWREDGKIRETSWTSHEASPSDLLSPIDPHSSNSTNTSSGQPYTQQATDLSTNTAPADRGQQPPPQIFTNLTFYINGSTAPLISDHKLKYLIASHGGSHSTFLGRRTVTHVLITKPASSGYGRACGGGLAGTKIQKEIAKLKGEKVRFVMVEWVLECVRQGKRVPERGFEGLRLAPKGVGSVAEMFGGGEVLQRYAKQMLAPPWLDTKAARPRSSRRWIPTLLFCILVAGTVNMLMQYSLPALFVGYLGCSTASPTVTDASNAYPTSSPWQWPGPNQGKQGYWFDQLEDTLATMQNTFWNGTYWPTTIQWIGAFMDTLLAASDISFTNALDRYNGGVPGAHSTSTSLTTEIQKYFTEIEAYYGDEDAIQIFGAAYDDAQWVVLEWLEAIKFIDQYDDYAKSSLGQNDIAHFAHRAHIFYNIVQNQFNTSLCGGGITWNPALAPYKNAITNELFLASSIGMYLYYPGDTNTSPYPSPGYLNATNMTLPALPALAAHDPLLLNNAVQEYAWFQSHNFTNAQGLVVDGFHISDNQTTCDERNEMVYTYNQGVLLSGLRGLWEATGDTDYLTDGYNYIKTTINATGWNAQERSTAGQWAGLGRNGIMEDYCDAPANCSQDNQIFKGIYFHHLDLFCEPLPTSTPLVAGLTHTASPSLAASHAAKCASYIPWIEHNAQAALSTRNTTGFIGGWWGASYVNKTQEPWPAYAVPRPGGSTDEWNEPWVLQSEPWSCQGQQGCGIGEVKWGNSGGFGHNGRRMAEGFGGRKRDGGSGRRDANDLGLGRTVETQASGLGVVRAASDFLSRRAAT
ncbi:hypothetical protein LTR78_007963 [Recurvomyces mirabilis]|uniref:BRCT domain-containing protein n=1 Tax=Recurvomyces mirabilis TaxID=574656 RepID=A0AAE0WHX0_9PEZI|nr:hypothetical protein LTR78_007963 [Recurvomyces mirabilis]KAK5152499.1 hypothetical protein LTS14_008446 [Recurvomyces mirabilis]